MSTADYAFIISIFSAAVALAGLVWNVWQKWVYPKARVRVSFATCCIMNADRHEPPWPRYLYLAATNFGPTEVTVRSVLMTLKRRWPWQKRLIWVANPIHDLARPGLGVGPFAGGLPKKLEVGEEHTAYFPYGPQCWGRDDLHKIGFRDVFGRYHWASQGDVKRVKAELDKEFSDEAYNREPAKAEENNG